MEGFNGAKKWDGMHGADDCIINPSNRMEPKVGLYCSVPK